MHKEQRIRASSCRRQELSPKYSFRIRAFKRYKLDGSMPCLDPDRAPAMVLVGGNRMNTRHSPLSEFETVTRCILDP